MTTWIVKTRESEAWANVTHAALYLGFDDTGFDSGYDYGRTAGLWSEKTQQSEVWALVP